MSRSRPILIVLALWLATGVYVVRVNEQAVVRRFGAVAADRVPPGLHLGFPWGIDLVDRLKVGEQKRLSVGCEAPDTMLGRPANPALREFFTGDQNLVNIELMLQYTIREPRAYLFAAADREGTLRQAAEAAVVAAVGARGVDVLLTTGKLEVQEDLRRRAQKTADSYGLGVDVTAINVQAVTPPVPVADAFREVASAREDRDRIIKQAESYANAAIPAAAGEASRMRQEALAYQEEKVRQARGDAGRFVQAYQAYRRAPDVTTARLYLEAVEEILPRMKIITLDRRGGRSPVDLNLFPRASGSPPANGTPPPQNAPSGPGRP